MKWLGGISVSVSEKRLSVEALGCGFNLLEREFILFYLTDASNAHGDGLISG